MFKGSTNYNKFGLLPGDPNLDDMIDKATTLVDLKQAVDAAKGQTKIIKMEGTEQPVANVSTGFMDGKAPDAAP